MLLLGWCPFKIQKEKWAGLQFTSADGMSLVSTPLKIRWTICSNESNAIIIGVYFNASHAEVITVTLKGTFITFFDAVAYRPCVQVLGLFICSRSSLL